VCVRVCVCSCSNPFYMCACNTIDLLVCSRIYGIVGNVCLKLTPTFLQVGCSALGRGFGVGWKSKKGGRGRRTQ